MIAQALAMDPALLVADEPTTALDVTVQAEILKLMRDLRDRIDAGVILITHDMGVVADLSDRVLVMQRGEIVESGTSSEVFYTPKHEYTQQLLAAVPHLGVDHRRGGRRPARGRRARTGRVDSRRAGRRRSSSTCTTSRSSTRSAAASPAFRAVDGVSMTVEPGEVVGLVGESGSGKTTIGRAIVGLLPFVEGEATILGTNMVGIDKDALRQVRRDVSFVFQDPGSSLNPRLPIGESIGEPLLLQRHRQGHRR